MSDVGKTDEQVIAELGIGRTFVRRRPGRPRKGTPPSPVTSRRGPQWTDSDNLRGREARVVGGTYDGLLVAVNERAGQYRYPDVLDLSAYVFDATTWTFQLREVI